MPRGISIPWMPHGDHFVIILVSNPENDKK